MKRKESLGTPVVARTVPPHREFQDLRDPSGQHACLDSVGRNSMSPIVTEGHCANIKKSERGESVFRVKPPDRGDELFVKAFLFPCTSSSILLSKRNSPPVTAATPQKVAHSGRSHRAGEVTRSMPSSKPVLRY